jgi:hypothetical protein
LNEIGPEVENQYQFVNLLCMKHSGRAIKIILVYNFFPGRYGLKYLVSIRTSSPEDVNILKFTLNIISSATQIII